MSRETYRAIISAAENILQTGGHHSQDQAIRSRDLVDAIFKLRAEGKLDVDVTRGTVFSYISSAANNDDNTPIASGGAWGGYWYDTSAPAEPEAKPVDEATIGTSQGREVSFLEKDLYPLVQFWLNTKEYEAKDISVLKGGGKWGNPDIIGIRRVELFGSVEVELASCEVKLSEVNWEQFIFEAISHKRFCNRSWFVYRVAQAEKRLPKAMEYYAERYKVGIVQILLTDEDLIKLKSSEQALTSEEFLDRVHEKIPALYEPVPLQEKASFFDRTKIAMTVSWSR